MPVYKPLTQEEITQLIEKFGVGKLDSFTQLSGGWANSNYWLQTEKVDYVLTVCETKTVQEARQLVNILKHLESNAFDSSICYPTSTGDEIAIWNHKPIILKSFIAGEMCEGLTSQLAFNLGEQLGILHQIPSPDFLPQIHAYGIEAFSSFNQSYNSTHPFVKWLKDMEDYIRPFLSDTLPKCIIHGDIFNDNLIVSDHEIVIMDFEESCYYYRVYDIGMTIVGTCFTNNQLDKSLVKQLITGYRSKTTLTLEEEEAIIPFAVYAAAGTALWRFRQFNILFPDEKLKDHYLEMCGFAEMLKKEENRVW